MALVSFHSSFNQIFGGMFDLMWALGSRRVGGQSVAIRAASHERTSNICGPESMQNPRTQGQRDAGLDTFEQTVQCQNILLWADRFRVGIFFWFWLKGRVQG